MSRRQVEEIFSLSPLGWEGGGIQRKHCTQLGLNSELLYVKSSPHDRPEEVSLLFSVLGNDSAALPPSLGEEEEEEEEEEKEETAFSRILSSSRNGAWEERRKLCVCEGERENRFFSRGDGVTYVHSFIGGRRRRNPSRSYQKHINNDLLLIYVFSGISQIEQQSALFSILFRDKINETFKLS